MNWGPCALWRLQSLLVPLALRDRLVLLCVAAGQLLLHPMSLLVLETFLPLYLVHRLSLRSRVRAIPLQLPLRRSRLSYRRPAHIRIVADTMRAILEHKTWSTTYE